MRRKNLTTPIGNLLHQRAMTLIEIIGVLAVLAILAAIILPALIKQTDKAVADQETARLQSFGDALQRNILRNRRIPGPAGLDWATNIAAEVGLDISSVTNNVRRQPRVFLVDTTGFGSLTLPYFQDNSGTALPPNPRLMIVSSLGKAMPTNLVSGGLSSGDFSNLWSAASGTVPTSGAWAGWKGNPNDITVQRVSLSPLFVNLWLSTYNSSWDCYYSIDSNAMSPPIGGWTNSCFLQNSVLNLYFTNVTVANGLTLDSQQILIADGSFVFYGNEWRRSIGTNALVASTGGSSTGTGTNLLGSYNYSSLINGFLSANPTLLTRSQQTNVVTSFIDYMNAYDTWAGANFPKNPLTLYNSVVQKQSIMQSYVDNLVGAIVVNYQLQ